MDGNLGWGFVGVSTIARQYMVDAVGADPRSSVTAVMSRSLSRAADFAVEHGVARAHDSVEGLLADRDVDVVYVSTTNERHFAEVVAAAEAGKHVLCDKPLALTVADASAMLMACDRAGVKIGTNHQMRQSPVIGKMRRLINEGAIGQPTAGRVIHGEPLPRHLQTWRIRDREGGGVALDLTVHVADTVRYLFAEEIVEVNALDANHGLASEGLSDTIVGVMRLGGGALISFLDSFTAAHAGTGIEVHGTEGSLVAYDVLTQRPSGELFLRRGGRVESVEVGPREDLYVRTIKQFNDAVLAGEEPSPSGRDGVMSLAVALAAVESARTGRSAPVVVDELSASAIRSGRG